jgi:WD40 repeat protein
LLRTASRESWEFIRALSGHEDWVCALAVSPDSRHVSSGSGDCTLRLWDLATGRLRAPFAGHDAEVSEVAVAPDGRHALSVSSDRTLRLWDLEVRARRALIPLETSLWTVALTPGGRTAVVGDRAGNIHHYQIQGIGCVEGRSTGRGCCARP